MRLEFLGLGYRVWGFADVSPGCTRASNAFQRLLQGCIRTHGFRASGGTAQLAVHGFARLYKALMEIHSLFRASKGPHEHAMFKPLGSTSFEDKSTDTFV